LSSLPKQQQIAASVKLNCNIVDVRNDYNHVKKCVGRMNILELEQYIIKRSKLNLLYSIG